jgi:hypothetical protein
VRVRWSAVAAVVAVSAGCAGPTAAPTGGGSTGGGSTGASPATPGACSTSVTVDRFSDQLDKTTFAGTYVGNLSALAMEPGGAIDALSDRSALFTLDQTTLRPTGVVALADEDGDPLDSEGLVVDTDGSRLITSETEPSVRRYSRQGRLLGRLPVPEPLRVAPAGRAGRNLTFEGLTLQPGGRTLVASMEGALSGDRGTLVRFQTWTRDSAGPASAFRLGSQYGFAVDPGMGVSEITAVGDGRLLVLERGYIPGLGNSARLALADPAGATDVGAIAYLTGQPGVRLMAGTPLADLARCPSLGATAKEHQTNPLLDNIEGMTVLGRDPSGALRLLLVSDDNQSRDQTTRLYWLTARPPR